MLLVVGTTVVCWLEDAFSCTGMCEKIHVLFKDLWDACPKWRSVVSCMISWEAKQILTVEWLMDEKQEPVSCDLYN